jgi:hypothetical protein
LQSETSYYPLDYKLEVNDCDSGENWTTKYATDPNPHPACSVSCRVDITDVQPNDEGTSIDISQTWTETNSYTCGIAVLGGSIDNGAAENTTVSLTTVNAVSADASPATWEALVWDNFPMTITASAVIHSDYLNADLCTASDSFDFQPPCDMSIDSHTFSAAIVEGAAWGDHKIKFTDSMCAYVGPYCPTMAGTRVVTNSGTEAYSQSVSPANMKTFSTATTDGECVSDMVQIVDFDEGVWCSSFNLEGAGNNNVMGD